MLGVGMVAFLKGMVIKRGYAGSSGAANLLVYFLLFVLK